MRSTAHLDLRKLGAGNSVKPINESPCIGQPVPVIAISNGENNTEGSICYENDEFISDYDYIRLDL